MQTKRLLRSATLVLTAAAVLAPATLAAGEPKNESPFTGAGAGFSLSANRSHDAGIPAVTSPSNSAVGGEAKNQSPFSRPTNSQPAAANVERRSGFSWTDAAIGAAAATGLLAIALGAVAIVSAGRVRRLATGLD